MSDNYKLGDVIIIKSDNSDEEIEAVITKIIEREGHYWFFIRRRDNKPFGKPYNKYNAWIIGPAIKEINRE